eukprot:923967-Pelagomonas_calceolata.AAC.1
MPSSRLSSTRQRALHTLSGCQNDVVSNMKTGRHNIAGRKVSKALSKSPWGAGKKKKNYVGRGNSPYIN